MSEALAHPDLYVSSGGDAVRLVGMRCGRCGHVAFPRQHFGCEKCGADDDELEGRELTASGRLTSFATVHMHQAKTIAAPFVIGEIELDDGPTIRITMVESSDEGMRIGARVRGALVAVPSSGDTPVRRELRFAVGAP